MRSQKSRHRHCPCGDTTENACDFQSLVVPGNLCNSLAHGYSSVFPTSIVAQFSLCTLSFCYWGSAIRCTGKYKSGMIQFTFNHICKTAISKFCIVRLLVDTAFRFIERLFKSPHTFWVFLHINRYVFSHILRTAQGRIEKPFVIPLVI